MERTAVIRSLFETSGKGLEIGPSYSPIVPKKEGFHVDIVDHLTTEALRAKYQSEPNVDHTCIEDVDYVWDGRPLPEVIGTADRYDYIVASHVIEHMPNMLGFLRDCTTLLTQSGVLVLAVPDKRRCFDVLRPISTTGSVLQAHIENRTRHVAATAFDHVAYFATVGGRGGWEAGTSGAVHLEHTLAFAGQIFDRSVTSDSYYDFHAWTFCPSSFRMILQDLYEIGALELRENKFQTTPHHEFFVTLSRHSVGAYPTREDLLLQVQHELAEFPS
jgi:Methyltransferase domain